MEFKFIIWDKEKKKMIYDPIEYELECIARIKGDPNWQQIHWIGFSPMEQELFEIMQYIGEVDKNGKEIYKDYIVKIPEGYGGDHYYQECIAVVKFEDSGFYPANPHDKYEIVPQDWWWKYTEVIGNIHENNNIIEEWEHVRNKKRKTNNKPRKN